MNIRKGIGETAAFVSVHPIVNLIYFLFVIGMTMFITHPLFLLVSLIIAWFYSGFLNGSDGLKRNLIVTAPVTVIVILINGFMVHNGATVLFYLNGERITQEAFLYGMMMALRLDSVLVWFFCFQVIMTEDKFLYLFGRISPAIALILSMVFRYIPLLSKRYEEIRCGQLNMGRTAESLSVIQKIQLFFKKVSILISWSLEASIETSDSMEARGYGLSGRSSFHLFKWRNYDTWLLLIVTGTGIISTAGQISGSIETWYYPVLMMPEVTSSQIIIFISFLILMNVPVIMDVVLFVIDQKTTEKLCE